MSANLFGSESGVIWGTVDQTAYVIEDISENGQAEETDFVNGQGDVVGVAVHGKKRSVTIRMKTRVTGSRPNKFANIGSTLTITGDTEFADTYIVTGVTNQRTKGDWAGGEVTARVKESGWSAVTTTTTT